MKTAHFISVDGVRTHYFEAGIEHRGKSPSILLLHSAEFGGAAEFSWEYNLGPLAERHHVLAPDHLGFGLTDKIFDFTGQFDRRIAHIRRFLDMMCVDRAHVIGSSMSGGLSLTVAARAKPDWPFASLIVCSGGGDAPDNEARKVLNTYDGSREHMRRIVDVMFVNPKWTADEDYIERRWQMTRVPGAWEATAAARFKPPFPQQSNDRRERNAFDYASIKVPTLVFAGRHDPLREPRYTDGFVPKIPGAQLHIFENAGHMGNIECAEEFNARVLAFLAGLR
ncbi:MAG TPA: alpha/beta hydrolase [Beijerinckiaceae bacterium]|nr:alpha/beta hydrolase [Beijerinckiaceae bacterium]